MRFTKYIFILFFFSYPCFSLENVDLCSSSFLNHSEFVKSFFSDPKNLSQYRGQEGYLTFVEEYLSVLKMNTVFNSALKVVSKDNRTILGWQQYRGTVNEFQKERLQILNEKGRIRIKYQGMEGYVRYADEFYGGEKRELGNMRKAYSNVSALLSKEDMMDLGWKMFFGNTGQFHALFEFFFEVYTFEQYQGLKGQKKIAKRIFDGHLRSTYANISILRSYLFHHGYEFEKLQQSGWLKNTRLAISLL